MSKLKAPLEATLRSTPEIYRDCLRLIRHCAGQNTTKSRLASQMVRQEFDRHANETDPEKVEELKFNAISGLSNYLMMAEGMGNKPISKKDE